MMKKFFTMILVFVAALALVGCGEKEFKVDGEFSAFELSVHQGGPMVTSVTVTVQKGKIVKYFIDARQGTVTKNSEGKITGVAWNAKTKKELGNEYGMKGVGPEFKFEDGAWTQVEGGTSKKEWFEQANAIESFWLANGHDAVTTVKDAKGDARINNVAGVTLKDGGYTKLAAAAVANAKAGKVIAFEHSLQGADPAKTTAQFTWVELVIEKGKIKSIFLDVRQSKVAADGSGLVWNAKTKKELGNEYGMKGVGPEFKFEDGAWSMVDGGTSKNEWFEQANAIEAFVLANGVDAVTTVKDAKGDARISNIAGVTLKDGGYISVIKAAMKAAGLDKTASKK
jgi:major membrane immunogen (membrane-anchored lipoprotein)